MNPNLLERSWVGGVGKNSRNQTLLRLWDWTLVQDGWKPSIPAASFPAGFSSSHCKQPTRAEQLH